MSKCTLCGGPMTVAWPSGVCSPKCLALGQGFPHYPAFLAEDGYRLWLVNGRWQDSLHPAAVDMTFDAGPLGPVDCNGEALPGYLED